MKYTTENTDVFFELLKARLWETGSADVTPKGRQSCIKLRPVITGLTTLKYRLEG